MNKHRNIVWIDDGLRLQEVVPNSSERFPRPGDPPYPFSNENPETEDDVVVALTWPRDTGWRSH